MPLNPSPLPPGAQRHQDMVQALLYGKPIATDPASTTEPEQPSDEKPETPPVPAIPLMPANPVPPPKPPPTRPNKKVILENDSMVMTFHVSDFTMGEFIVAFRFNPKDADIHPKPGTRFTLAYEGSKHNVVYTGVYISFENDPYHTIAFHLDKDPK